MFNFDVKLKKRVAAFTIDQGLVITINYFLMAAFTDFLKIVFFHFPIRTQLILIQKFKLIHSVSLLSIMFAYFSIFYFITNGRTMGKMIMGLTVKSKQGEITLTQAIVRALSYVFCAWFASLPFLVSFFRKDQKSIADIISGSDVLLEPEKKDNSPKTEFQLTLVDTIYEANETIDLGSDNKKAS